MYTRENIYVTPKRRTTGARGAQRYACIPLTRAWYLIVHGLCASAAARFQPGLKPFAAQLCGKAVEKGGIAPRIILQILARGAITSMQMLERALHL